MNAETIAKLIVMVCEVIKERSGGTGLEARIADRVLAEVTPVLADGNRPHRRLPGDRPLLTRGTTDEKGARS